MYIYIVCIYIYKICYTFIFHKIPLTLRESENSHMDCIAFALTHVTLCMSQITAVYFSQRMLLFIRLSDRKTLDVVLIIHTRSLPNSQTKQAKNHKELSKRSGEGKKVPLESYRAQKSKKISRFCIFVLQQFYLRCQMHLVLKVAKCHWQRWEKAGHRDNYTETEENQDSAVIQQETFLLNYQRQPSCMNSYCLKSQLIHLPLFCDLLRSYTISQFAGGLAMG